MLHSPRRQDPLASLLGHRLTLQGGDAPQVALANDLTGRFNAAAPLRTFVLEFAWQAPAKPAMSTYQLPAAVYPGLIGCERSGHLPAPTVTSAPIISINSIVANSDLVERRWPTRFITH